ncbi:unnamed protein product [Darwinula stevensoni]|uniref:Ribosome biogenesis protein NOP53 n=1 Tax=Darwinula stevensoni TaxID=69355 RepID=A0A7R9ABG2_9CRUS|nr:unnamed protein product [Darwinula stevensoni]CAG0898866.1 unnamed protein product [Darwinula stevensoni]
MDKLVKSMAETEEGIHSGKKRKYSKNKKKNWKRSDVTDVEEFLDAERQDERLGAGKLQTVPSDNLFIVENVLPEETQTPKNDASTRSKKVEIAVAKAYGHLRNVSEVIDPLKKRNRVRTPLERKGKLYALQERLRLAAGRLKLKERDALHQTQQYLKKRKVKLMEKKQKFEARNVWDTSDMPEEVKNMDKDLFKYTFIDKLKKVQPKRPYTITMKQTVLPSVELPLPGTSYNPSFEEHQELLQKALEVEIKKEKKLQKIERQTTLMFPTADKAPTEESKLLELSEGLFEEESEKPVQKVEAGETEEIYKAPIRDEDRKTRKRRRKEHQEKMKLLEAKQKKEERLKEAGVFRINAINRELKLRDQITKERIERRLKREAEKLKQPRVLSRFNYEEPDIELKLSEEVTGSLRELKPEGHLLADRFKSLQRRSIIEPRIKLRLRKKKMKRFEKRGHRKFGDEMVKKMETAL